ncbi:hypothetical protein BGX28_007944 [Mortierella sp. GBA30]|nr:hypothetical protein BGX28_007944 [Mortierella sp. GBA30]
MHVLRTQEILHENPYTGDRITKARIVRFQQISHDENKSSVNQKHEEHKQQSNVVPTSTACDAIQTTETGTDATTRENTQVGDKVSSELKPLPEFVVIKYLSDYRIVRQRQQDETREERLKEGGWSSSSSDSEDETTDSSTEDESKEDVTSQQPSGTRIRNERLIQRHMWTLIGQDVRPQGIKFGVKAKREIRALRASQGHPNESPHLFRSAEYNNDFDSDEESSDDDWIDVEPGSLSPGAATQYWNHIFSRQPRLGGIILPYIPITLQDMIRVGWTKTRPLLIETCMRQILDGLAWIHDEAGLIHRDISSGNILITVNPIGVAELTGQRATGRGIAQCMISDFGCATFSHQRTPDEHGNKTLEGSITESGNQEFPHPESEVESRRQYKKGLTFEVGTRAYRAPELLFSSGDYTNTVDIWSAGVLFAEMYLGRSLFKAESDIAQICAIVKVLGTPTEENWPEYPSLPDYGKLVFKALETTPLSSILLPALDAEGHHERSQNSAHDSSHVAQPTPTAICATALELIERMIVYSGAARPSAREALDFEDRCLDQSTQLLEKMSEKIGEDDSVQSEQSQGKKQAQDYLHQCTVDAHTILDELQRLREREEDEAEDGEFGFGGGPMFGGFRDTQTDHDPYGYFSSTGSEVDNVESGSEVERRHQSDDNEGGDREDLTTEYGRDDVERSEAVSRQGEKAFGHRHGHEAEAEEQGPERAVKRRCNSNEEEEGDEVRHP